MWFRSVQLKNYRNFVDRHLEFSRRINFFIGPNGQGKTNLIEGLYFVTQGKSFRFGDNESVVMHGKSESLVRAELRRRGLDFQLLAHLHENKKNFVLNEKRVTGFDLRRKFPVVLFSPESLSAIKEGGEHRRNLIDDFLITIDETMAHIQHEYRKALKARNRLLKSLQEAESPRDRGQLMDVFESLNPRFYELAGNLTWYRLKAIEEIQSDLRTALQNISGSTNVDVSVEMRVSDQNAMRWNAQTINAAIQQRARELAPAEVRLGASLVGPHKHDIRFLYNQKDSRIFCSQGQQRVIILAFKMAQIVYHRKVHGFYPVLMLDDVLSELDAEKRNALIGFLREINTQVFLTSTDLTLHEQFSMEDSQVFQVAVGNVVNG